MVQLKLFCILILSVTSVLGAPECYTCSSKNDCSKNSENSEPCIKKEDTCTTIFGDTETEVIKRGCSLDLQFYCKQAKDKCYQCKSNKCNNAINSDDYIECLDCNSDDDENCANGEIMDKKKCHKSCMEYVVSNKNKLFDTIIRTCLDDFDIEEQKECTDGTNELCKACRTPNCNEETRTLKCEQCDTDDCMEPELKECAKFSVTDQCYTLFENANIKKMGCLSSNKQLTPDKIKELEDKKLLFLCKGDDCNKETIPKTQQCTLCHSKTDKKCAQNPKEVTAKTSCTVEGDNACYMKVSDADKSTQRGCWSSLTAEEKLNCKSDNKNGNCTACNGPNCNNRIFPENRQECHVCNSKDDSTCATNNPNKATICLNYDRNDQCVSKLSDSITYRSCVSDSEKTTCHGSDRTCRQCKLPKCNIIDFKNVINDTDNYGMWQELPITCLSCYGDSCQENKTTNVKCKENLEDCMTVFNKEGVVIIRGCEKTISHIYEIHCQLNPYLCFNCKSDNCNVATKLNDFVNCTYCGWPNSPNCMEIDTNKEYSKRSCYKSCISALYNNYIDEEEPAYNLIRTCMDDKLPNDQQECKTLNDENDLKCMKCDSKECNNKNDYPKNRTSCHICNNHEECKNPNSKKCPLYRANDECYYVYNDKQIITEKGCKSSMKQQAINDLLIQNKIHLCNGTECNTAENAPKNSTCVICNSKDDVNCAIDPSKLNKNVTCEAPNSQCYTRVNKDGYTERGCIVALKEDMFKCNGTVNANSTCQSCADASCNKKVFPENRRACQICSSSKDKKCHDKPKFLQICPLFVENETCVSTFNKKDKITERGCGQTLKCTNEKDKKTCQICEKDNCNTVDLKKINGSGTIMGNFMIISLLSVGLIIFTNKN